MVPLGNRKFPSSYVYVCSTYIFESDPLISFSEYHPEMILYCVTTTSMVDPLAAHVLFFALYDISSGVNTGRLCL